MFRRVRACWKPHRLHTSIFVTMTNFNNSTAANKSTRNSTENSFHFKFNQRQKNQILKFGQTFVVLFFFRSRNKRLAELLKNKVENESSTLSGYIFSKSMPPLPHSTVQGYSNFGFTWLSRMRNSHEKWKQQQENMEMSQLCFMTLHLNDEK